MNKILKHKIKGLFNIPALLIVCLFVIFSPVKSYTQVAFNDSMDLVNFYNMTNGPNWYNNDNWLTGPISTWAGIELGFGTRVWTINLSNNNLTGSIQEAFQHCDSIVGIFLQRNNLTGTLPEAFGVMSILEGLSLGSNHFTGQIPGSLGSISSLFDVSLDSNDFIGRAPDTILKRTNPFQLLIRNNHFDTLPYYPGFNGVLCIQGNHFTFEDVIPYLNNQPLWYIYSPQDSILEEIDTTVLLNSNVVLDSWIDSCSNNKYRWKKNGIFLSPTPTFISTLNLSNIQYADSGYYSCDVSNIDAPLLVLHRKLIHVHVSDGASTPQIIQNDLPFKISFNQAENFLNIQFDFITKKNIDCQLINPFGQKIMLLYKGKSRSQELHYYLNWLKPGVYIIRTVIDNQLYTRKIQII